jgi:aminodeoxyfutalosine synthase
MAAELDLSLIRDPALRPIADYVASGRRLDAEQGRTLYQSPDLIGLGTLADFANQRVNGDRVFFSANQHINPTNICILRNTCADAEGGRRLRPEPG